MYGSNKLFVLLCLVLWSLDAAAGPFAPAAGQPNSTAIAMPTDPNDHSVFVGWATGVSIEKGLQQINAPFYGYPTHGLPSDALGPAQGGTTLGVVSLGDGGRAVLTFEMPIANGPGYDFAVFENGFAPNPSEPNIMFLEFAFVEVSSDGIHYERFPAISLTPIQTQVTAFDSTSTTDTTNIHNLAGKYSKGYGTPFDLDELKNVNDWVDVGCITHVRLIDVVGSIDDLWATCDSQGHKINDPWATPFSNSGFDLDAVGVLHQKTLQTDFSDDGIVNLEDFAMLAAVYINDNMGLEDLLSLSEEWLQTERWYQVPEES